ALRASPRRLGRCPGRMREGRQIDGKPPVRCLQQGRTFVRAQEAFARGRPGRFAEMVAGSGEAGQHDSSATESAPVLGGTRPRPVCRREVPDDTGKEKLQGDLRDSAVGDLVSRPYGTTR